MFRDERTRALATLVRELGDIELAEDCLQDAFVSALAAWKGGVLPDRPGAWILTAARRRAVDALRRRAVHDRKAEPLSSVGRVGLGELDTLDVIAGIAEVSEQQSRSAADLEQASTSEPRQPPEDRHPAPVRRRIEEPPLQLGERPPQCGAVSVDAPEGVARGIERGDQTLLRLAVAGLPALQPVVEIGSGRISVHGAASCQGQTRPGRPAYSTALVAAARGPDGGNAGGCRRHWPRRTGSVRPPAQR